MICLLYKFIENYRNYSLVYSGGRNIARLNVSSGLEKIWDGIYVCMSKDKCGKKSKKRKSKIDVKIKKLPKSDRLSKRNLQKYEEGIKELGRKANAYNAQTRGRTLN